MINGIRVKVCGLTSVADAEVAASCGADYLGVILYPKSPRYVPLDKARELIKAMPAGPKKVGVVVYSSTEELAQYKDAGFDHIQLHFPNSTAFFEALQWPDMFPHDMLWLAPRVPHGREMDLAFLPVATTFLIDSYHPTAHGGTGTTGDWATFARLQARYQRINWILAGGLSPANIASAVAEAHAQWVDVNSGVETSPGVKDHAKLRAFFDALKPLSLPPL